MHPQCGRRRCGTLSSFKNTARESGEGDVALTVHGFSYKPPGRSLSGTGNLERQCQGGGATEAAPPPTYQWSPLSGRSWLPLPLGEKALFSFPATDEQAGGGCWTENTWSSKPGRSPPCPCLLHTLRALPLPHQLQGEGSPPGWAR